MRFWDSSALVPLLVDERTSSRVLDLLRKDAGVYVWWATPVECVSALARREREGTITPEGARSFILRLEALRTLWSEIEPVGNLRELAQRYLRAHTLRSADALQLAAAFVASEQRPPTLEFVTLDDRLRLAAEKEGFQVVEV